MGCLNSVFDTHCFYTVTSAMMLGALHISDRGGRKKRDEPFNPFAPNASAQRNKRQTERKNMERRPPQARPNQTEPQSSSGMSELAKKQKEAMERMKKQQGGAGKTQANATASPKTAQAPTMTNSVAKAPAAEPRVSNEDRLAELRRKSELSKLNAKSKTKQEIEVAVETVTAEPVTVESPADTPVNQEVSPTSVKPESISSTTPQSKDVFKTVEVTVAKTNTDRRRKRRRQDKKGGGRQKQEKKLNRQKYLEYKYAARDLLDNPSIPEEHRSNVLGQIWAKGERIGVADSLEFIDQKVLEEILPESVAQKLRDLVNKMTTRR
jgi:hypothetical protein